MGYTRKRGGNGLRKTLKLLTKMPKKESYYAPTIFDKTKHEYTKYMNPDRYIEMNEYGKYPELLPRNEKNVSGLIPKESFGEKAWKTFQNEKLQEDLVIQNHPDIFFKKKEDSPDTEESPKKSLTNKSPHMPSLVNNNNNNILASNTFVYPPAIMDTEYKRILRSSYKAIIEDTSKWSHFIGIMNKLDTKYFIGWDKAAEITRFRSYSRIQQEYILQKIIAKTAEGVAISRQMLFSLYSNSVKEFVWTSKVTELRFIILFGLYKSGSIKTINALISMASNKNIDWKDPRKIEEWDKNLGYTLVSVLEILFADLVKQGCFPAIPKILGHIVHKDHIESLQRKIAAESKTNPDVESFLVLSNAYCNKIVPTIASNIKKRGLKSLFDSNVKQQLVEYIEDALPLVKDVLWNIVKHNLSDVWIDVKQKMVADDAENEMPPNIEQYRDLFDELFRTKSLDAFLKIIMRESQVAYDRYKVYIDSDERKEAEEMIDVYKSKSATDIPNGVLKEELLIKEKIVNRSNKLSIGDFILDINGSIQKLIQLWDKEIYSNIDSSLGKVDCLLNILDIRLSTLIIDTCRILQYKKDLCSEDFRIVAAKLETAEGMTKSDIDYAKGVIKHVIIDTFVKPMMESDIVHTYTEGYILLNSIAI